MLQFFIKISVVGMYLTKIETLIRIIFGQGNFEKRKRHKVKYGFLGVHIITFYIAFFRLYFKGIICILLLPKFSSSMNTSRVIRKPPFYFDIVAFCDIYKNKKWLNIYKVRSLFDFEKFQLENHLLWILE